MSKIPLLDLQAQYEPIMSDVLQAVARVFASKQFIMGPEVEEMERALAGYCRVPYALGVSSGTDALILALMALGIGPGDEVITSPFTFFATAGSIARLGAIPVFVDIDPQTMNIDPTLIEAAISPKTKAIMPVHIFGQMADMEAIMAIATKHNLRVIEDASQAIGCYFTDSKGKRHHAGAVGDVGCFSFFPSKNLGGCGDGGMVTTKNAELAATMKLLRNHGAKERYYHDEIGGNFRLDTIQAAVILVKLPYIEEQHLRRQVNASQYNQGLSDVVEIPYVRPNFRMIYHQYTIRTSQRDALQKHLNAAEIGNAVYYPVPLHLQACFTHLGYTKGSFPHTEQATAEVLSLPIYAELSKTQISEVISSIREFFN